ncbi:uncharacterized protein LOC110507151 [Oncorhynchus mykiss]|uniref:Threonylcarbamoyl-AMP synthase n=2 Tax=Oncorhynchus mykiss TaxID=8022 RepID=A0A8C7WGX3_ONCMY|nr:uncharacterized protein LOC110507151 [Oncorhynchus mykiss]
MAELESLHFSVGILGISGGSLLLLVNNYGSSPDKDFIPHTALGVLLLIIASLLAYSGVRRSLSQSQLFSSVCLTVSALWCGSGLVYLLVGEGLVGTTELRSSLVPGLAAFTLAFLILATVSVLQREVVLLIISLSISLACGHQIAGLSSPGFGQSATAACYLLVTLVGAYFGCGRLLSFITQGRVEAPGTGLRRRAGGQGSGVRAPEDCNDVVPVGLVMNLLSASVIACPLLAVVPQLAPGHVPWLWTAAVFQLVVCVLSYRSMDSLTATFYGFTSILRFAEGYSALLTAFSIHTSSPIPFPVVFAVLFFILALFSCQKSLAEGLYQLFYVAYTIALAAQPSLSFQSGAQGVQAAIFVVSAVMLLVTSYNNVSAKRIPTGEGVFKALVTRVSSLTLRPHDRHSQAPYLGYSRYADAEVLGHACSVLAVFSITASMGDRAPLGVLVLPWAVVAGGVLQLLVGSVAFSRGKTLESMAFVLYGVMWSVWGLTRYGGLYGDTRGFNLAVGIISFLLFNSLVTVGALFLSVAWVVYAATFHLIIISFLLDAMGALPYGYDIGVSIVFGLMSFYCFLSGLFSLTFLTPQLPLGRALVRLSGTGGGGKDICLHVPARKATAVHQIAEIMKSGGICGMPTDTVYVLVAACNRPDAVEKAYKCKQQAQDRPMSLWVSSINQLEPVRSLLSALLWDFMSAAWPSSISMVIARGPWMEMFGLGESAKHIGTPQSIAIRNPNCAVATHLINLVGPIAVTSANPTGEADTTHHNQVYAKLGDKVDGVLCDGPSPENIASTVVDCTKIDSGHIGFFRVGLIPKSQVLQIFEEVQKRHSHGQINPGFEADLTEPDPNPNLTDPQRNTEEDNTESTESSTVPPPTQSPANMDTSTLTTQP